jgi:D-glucuronyl C5-epimerase C-terminus
MNYFKNAWHLFDNYLLARWQQRPSTALFWYLPEPPTIHTKDDLLRYQTSKLSPLYPIDYRQKLQYSLENKDGIIVLPYQQPIGQQVNPEAAFQYALGLHDQFCLSQEAVYLEKFWHYADYFLRQQTKEGLWEYKFDWYGSKAPWYSALAQARGASVMLRAWKQSNNTVYLDAAKNALTQFHQPISEGGFLHLFPQRHCAYFEEYPKTPTGVINGFMAALISIWELKFWLAEKWLDELWTLGISSLETMLPYYSTGWWSLYDLDSHTPIANVNSPRYHLLEIHYLQVLSLLSESSMIVNEHQKRVHQYASLLTRLRALCLKFTRKIIYK